MNRAKRQPWSTHAFDRDNHCLATQDALQQRICQISTSEEAATAAKSVANEPAEPREWSERRGLALKRLDDELVAMARRRYPSPPEVVSYYNSMRRNILYPDWRPERPPRRTTAPHLIARHWVGRGVFDVDVDNPACFRCRRQVSSWKQLERAHLVDRCAGGLDIPSNIAMLCWRCHGTMPPFGNGEGEDAIQWVLHCPSFSYAVRQIDAV